MSNVNADRRLYPLYFAYDAQGNFMKRSFGDPRIAAKECKRYGWRYQLEPRKYADERKYFLPDEIQLIDRLYALDEARRDW